MPFILGFLAAGLLLCYCPHRVTCIDSNRLKTSVAYVRGLNITPRQHAYAIKMSKEECDTLDNNVMDRVLNNDSADDIISFIEQGDVYEGNRIAFAKPYKNGKYWDHAEYRLLVADSSGTSPVQRLLETGPHDCVLFYTLLSPCLSYCLDPAGDYTIIPYLNVFDRVDNNYKAFSFSLIYKGDCCNSSEVLWNGWRQVNNHVPFFRCGNQRCTECFDGGPQSRDRCLAGWSPTPTRRY